MSKTFKDIFNLNIKYVEYLLEKSLFTHSYAKNISASGSFVETEIREMFRNILPNRFHVTHGYIVSANDQTTEPVVSPQVDMIIVDTLVPHSIFIVDKENGMEIVPKEAVVGIFEIKRKLNQSSLLGTKGSPGAFEHLDKIINKVGITKFNDERFLPGGIPMGKGLKGGYYNNPLVGIISLEHEKSLTATFPEGFSTGKEAKARAKTIDNLWIRSSFKPPIDVIASLDGMLYALVNSTPPYNLLPQNIRDKKVSYRHALIKKTRSRSQAFVVSRIFGFTLAYLQNATGKHTDVQKYFFNTSI